MTFRPYALAALPALGGFVIGLGVSLVPTSTGYCGWSDGRRCEVHLVAPHADGWKDHDAAALDWCRQNWPDDYPNRDAEGKPRRVTNPTACVLSWTL